MPIPFRAKKPAASECYVQPGDYQLRVIEAIEDTSNSGDDMIRLKFGVLKDDGTEGPTLFDYLVFKESSLWKINHFLASCGQHPGDNERIEIDPSEMIDWICEATLSLEESDGRKVNKVTAYLWDEAF